MRIHGIRRMFRFPLGVRAGQAAKDVDAELEFHLDLRIEELIDQGMAPAVAREEALRRFGDLARIKRDCREIGARRETEGRRSEALAELRQDLRYAARQMAKAPAFFRLATS